MTVLSGLFEHRDHAARVAWPILGVRWSFWWPPWPLRGNANWPGLECFCVDEVCDNPARGKRLATNPLPTGSQTAIDRDHQRLQLEGSGRWGCVCQDDVGFQADFVGPRKHADAPHAVALLREPRGSTPEPRDRPGPPGPQTGRTGTRAAFNQPSILTVHYRDAQLRLCPVGSPVRKRTRLRRATVSLRCIRFCRSGLASAGGSL